MFSPTIKLYGSDQPLPEQVPLRAGPLSLIYENGDLRYVKLGEREVLRRVYVAVRDHNWDTIPAVLSDIKIESDDDCFTISYRATHRQGDIQFEWHAHIGGQSDGTLSFKMTGEAQSTFRRNRIGFCVLHPMACAGHRAIIEQTDGSLAESRFPVQIAPQLAIDGTIHPVAPFADMRALSHEVQPGILAKVVFTGDTFEMEDQRNWTDASYKTYSTPLALPFPVQVAAGTTIEQSVVLSLGGLEPEEPSHEEHVDAAVLNKAVVGNTVLGNTVLDNAVLDNAVLDNAVSIKVSGDTGNPIPALGVGMASHPLPLSEREMGRLRALNLSHIRVDLHLHEGDYLNRLREAVALANQLGVALEMAIFVGSDAVAALTLLRRHLDELMPPVCRWLLFQADQPVTPQGLVPLARDLLASYAPEARFGAGTDAYFTDINRQHPAMRAADFLTYSLNPQVHAFDNASLIETVEAQSVTVESASQIAGGKGVVVSPVTLLPRFNPNATGPEPEPGPDELPAQVDLRQMSLFGAAWTVGSLKYLLSSGIDAVTYFETSGWRGLMEAEAGSSAPSLFPSTPGMLFPLYHVLADVGDYVDGEIVPVTTAEPLRVDGLALRRGDDLTLLLANMTPRTEPVQIAGMGSLARIRFLDASTFDEAVNDPDAFRNHTETLASSEGDLVSQLPPYAVVRIDTNVKIQALLDECLPLIKAMGKGRKAISIGGSYGKGTSDRQSDIDFRLFCDETITPNMQETDVWQQFDAAVKRWRAEGIDIDHCWIRKVDQIDLRLDAWLNGDVQPDDYVWCLWGYHLLTDLTNQVVLDDPDGLIAGWQMRLTPYPRALQQAIIDKHMGSLKYWRNDYHYRNKVDRKDVVFLAGVTSRLVHDMLQILFALNEAYYVGDGKNLTYAAGFSIVPDDFVRRVEAILYPAPSDKIYVAQYEALLALVDDVIELVQESS